MAITAFLSRFPGLLDRGPGGQPLCDMVLILASSLQLIWTSCRRGYIIIWRPPTTCERHNFELNSTPWQSRSLLISWYLRPDAPVIYTGAFVLLTAWPSRRSICNIISRTIIGRESDLSTEVWLGFMACQQLIFTIRLFFVISGHSLGESEIILVTRGTNWWPRILMSTSWVAINYTWLWDAGGARYSPKTTRRECLYSLEHGHRIYGFMSTRTFLMVEIFATRVKFLQPSVCQPGINFAFTFLTRKVFNYFCWIAVRQLYVYIYMRKQNQQ